MKNKTAIFLFVVLLSFISNKAYCFNTEEKRNKELTSGSNSDSLQKVSFGVIKINPLQAFFSEIPVSFELYLPHRKSLQFQVGYIFPIKKKSIFDGAPNMDNEHLFSYRNSPYNSKGFSFRIEYRKYGNKIYYGPQLLYKYSFYKSKEFSVYGIDYLGKQTESKYANVFGLGYFIGKESEKGTFVLDWYGGIGYRIRLMGVRILKVENPDYEGGTTYPNVLENFNSGYPFINLGLRVGIRLKKTGPL